MPVTTPILTAVPILLALQLGCAGGPPPATTSLAVTDSIPESEIRQEMDSLHGGTSYGVLLGILGVPVGLVIGAKIGYEIDLPNGGEDPGLNGLATGGFVGMTTAPIIGAVVGSNIDRKNKRAEAIRRIRTRRAQQTR